MDNKTVAANNATINTNGHKEAPMKVYKHMLEKLICILGFETEEEEIAAYETVEDDVVKAVEAFEGDIEGIEFKFYLLDSIVRILSEQYPEYVAE